MPRTRLTRRGVTVLVVAAFVAAFAIGIATARWNWYGGWTP